MTEILYTFKTLPKAVGKYQQRGYDPAIPRQRSFCSNTHTGQQCKKSFSFYPKFSFCFCFMQILDQLEKMQLSGQTPTYTRMLQIILPVNTRAILISIFCSFATNGHAYLNDVNYQKDNDNVFAKAEGYYTYYNVYANTFLYKQMIP